MSVVGLPALTHVDRCYDYRRGPERAQQGIVFLVVSGEVDPFTTPGDEKSPDPVGPIVERSP